MGQCFLIFALGWVQLARGKAKFTEASILFIDSYSCFCRTDEEYNPFRRDRYLEILLAKCSEAPKKVKSLPALYHSRLTEHLKKSRPNTVLEE